MYDNETRMKEMFDYYQQWWESKYDPRSVIFNKLDRLVEQRLGLLSGEYAIDIGSGLGKSAIMLQKHFSNIVCVEPNPTFCGILKERLPSIILFNDTAQNIVLDREYDLCLMLQVAQNISASDLKVVLKKLSKSTHRIHITISNSKSFHGWWVTRMKFIKPFVSSMTTKDFDKLLLECDLHIEFKRGVGLLTPVTARSGFRGQFIPKFVARAVGMLDSWFTPWCHFIYYECLPNIGHANEEKES